MSNPTSGADKSDASGRFPQVFAAEGSIFDVLLKDAAGSTLATELSVISLGSNTGALVRDFTSSRLQGRGSGGTTYLEAGDPVGDDVGGTGSLGGWNGTQADAWTINAVLVNILGRIKENSKKLASIVYTEATPFTGVATVDIALPNSPTGTRGYEVDIWDLSQTGVATAILRGSFDGGGTFKAGVADYQFGGFMLVTGTGVTASGGGTSSSMLLTTQILGSANRSARIRLSIITPDSGTEDAIVSSRTESFDGSNTSIGTYTGYMGASYGRMTHVRLLLSGAGTLTGKYLVRAARGYGET